MLGIQGVDPPPERDLVGYIDGASCAARSGAGTAPRDIIELRFVPSDEAKCVTRLGIFQCESRAQAGACTRDNDCMMSGFQG